MKRIVALCVAMLAGVSAAQSAQGTLPRPDVLPVLIRSSKPVYSEEARANKISGTVEVYLRIDETGNVTETRAVRGPGFGLNEKAVEAVKKYRFKPAIRDGKSVPCEVYVAILFQTF